MRKLTALLILMIITISGCSTGLEPSGFWQGIWHGVILPFSFCISIFNPDVLIYSINNSGVWYDFGFITGISILFRTTS